jgi:paraquat-inducible protein A
MQTRAADPVTGYAIDTERECHGCGLVESVRLPASSNSVARCTRCGTTHLRSRTFTPDASIALTLAALILLLIVCTTTLMHVQAAGMTHAADLFGGPVELVQRGMPSLAVVVLFTTVLAPLLRLLAVLYVLLWLRRPRVPGHVRRVFALSERLKPWAMIDVFIFGVFVAYVKLGDLVQIDLAAGVFALLALTFVVTWSDYVFDREGIWRALDRATPATAPADSTPSRDANCSCETCGWLAVAPPVGATCRRCGSILHPRKPMSVQRTWALVLAAAVLYIPANAFPVLTVVQLGAGAPSTIIGGVRELITSGMYPLAALVFFASIAVPMLKLMSLSLMLLAIQTRRSAWLRDRTRLYRFVRGIGRWSMIDIYMESLLGALVKFGAVVTIQPGFGAVAFCAVVILTMFAAETFDPRLMWDAAA